MQKTYRAVFDEPSPRLRFEGDVCPLTGKPVLRQDALGYRSARRAIAKETPSHPSLKDLSLWPDLQGKHRLS